MRSPEHFIRDIENEFVTPQILSLSMPPHYMYIRCSKKDVLT